MLHDVWVNYTKLGTNAVIKATVKERNNLCIHDTSILAFTFKVTHWITWCILTVISFYDHTCNHARVISKISFGMHWIVFIHWIIQCIPTVIS